MAKNDEDKFNFIYKNENQQITKSNSLSLNFDEFDLSFYAKDDPHQKLSIKDFQSICDSVLDQKNSLIYFVCYQKVNNGKIKNINKLPTLFFLKENSVDKKATEYYKRHYANLNDGIDLFARSVILVIVGILVAVYLIPFLGIIILVIGVIFALISIIFFINETRFSYTDSKIKGMKKKTLKRNFLNPFLFNSNLINSERPKYVIVDINNKVDENSFNTAIETFMKDNFEKETSKENKIIIL